MDDEQAWALEARLWLAGTAAFAAFLDEACVMAFPGMGVMRAGAVLESLATAPRWTSVRITERAVGRVGAGVIVLGYHAEGRREGAEVYHAVCTSTWRAARGEWLLVQHQQTPVLPPLNAP